MQRVMLAAAAFLLLGPVPVQAQADGHPCAVITCDCETIQAGILTRGWRADCRACQRQRIELCQRSYPPLERGIAAAGYCRTSCSVHGDNPYPEPPPGQEAAPADRSTEPASPASRPIPVLRLGCARNQRRETAEIDGMTFVGCVDANGRRQGLWRGIDGQGRSVEIVYVNGKQRSRVVHSG